MSQDEALLKQDYLVHLLTDSPKVSKYFRIIIKMINASGYLLLSVLFLLL